VTLKALETASQQADSSNSSSLPRMHKNGVVPPALSIWTLQDIIDEANETLPQNQSYATNESAPANASGLEGGEGAKGNLSAFDLNKFIK